MAPSEIPKCAKSFKFYIYRLPSRFNDDLITEYERQRGTSSCDFARSPCLELVRDHEYSSMRQYAADIPILGKKNILIYK
jgi:hypothetical protein